MIRILYGESVELQTLDELKILCILADRWQCVNLRFVQKKRYSQDESDINPPLGVLCCVLWVVCVVCVLCLLKVVGVVCVVCVVYGGLCVRFC